MNKIVVAWHNPNQLAAFLEAWNTSEDDPILHLQHDANREGCARTKNLGVAAAMDNGAEIVVILDSDCYPSDEAPNLKTLLYLHTKALQPQPVPAVRQVTNPASRGTPYYSRTRMVPVAASLGYWIGIGDYDACGQLIHGPSHPMTFYRRPIVWESFAYCGMNVALRPKEWLPWCQFIDVPRFDDIFCGWLFQKEAYLRGHCFNMNGPLVTHSRQSNVWQNLRDESVHLERNETLWRDIAEHPSTDYDTLRALLPV